MWTPPKNNWNVNDIVTAQDLNAIGDNLNYLKTPNFRARVTLTPATSTNATSFFATRATLSPLTRGGDLMVGFYANVSHTVGSAGYFDIALDGVRVALDGFNGSLRVDATSTRVPVSLSLLITGVTTGSHTLTLQWRTDQQWLEMGIGQFWAFEL
ncbi:MAG: hypothetical protein MUF87_16760 [Anaerolineae bacterium]|jgi:hypothetical protein|nr:hypothetical protein [Anaerolineae bacterium]